MQLAVTQIFFRHGNSLNKVSVWGSDLLQVHLDYSHLLISYIETIQVKLKHGTTSSRVHSSFHLCQILFLLTPQLIPRCNGIHFPFSFNQFQASRVIFITNKDYSRNLKLIKWERKVNFELVIINCIYKLLEDMTIISGFGNNQEDLAMYHTAWRWHSCSKFISFSLFFWKFISLFSK